jgi:GMP synthase (glutamine-hydrolysing)
VSADRPILVLDFGAQYAQLIARRIRECRVLSELVPHDITLDQIRALDPAGIVLSGGPASVNEPGAPRLDPGIFELGLPVLGICYGMQAMAQALGGEVAGTGTGEFGKTEIALESDAVLFHGVPATHTCWMSHNDSVTRLPDGFRATASTPGAPTAAMEDVERRFHAVQFHPEVIHTPFGTELIERFAYAVCGQDGTWTPQHVIDEQIARIRAQVGDQRVLCALSGGVDSAVAALLVHRAVGEQLTCVFVDHGMLREGEAEQVVETFGNHYKVDLVHVQAQDRFLDLLAGVTEPEQKRKIIGETFIRVFEEESRRLEGIRFLVQGTLYSDVIESGSKTAAKIKSHHNVGGLPDDMDLELCEPLRLLFKDEVRKVGIELGMPDRMVWRQPFPGPGLGIRIIGDITRERLDILRRADFVLQEEIRAAGWYNKVWQSFAVLPCVKSVGVMGDARTYEYPIIIRAVTSEDAMTADWARLPYDLLERISTRIINEVQGVNRVALDISSKPPGTIEWE